MSLGITLCITAGGRPDLLQATLRSLLPYNGKFFKRAFVTNDRGDLETDAVVRAELGETSLLRSDQPLGQNRSIDKLYSHASTAYVFHCEDDWAFDPVEFVPMLHAALEATPNASGVWARQTGSIQGHAGARVFQAPVQHGGASFVQFEAGDPWSGYSFSPHLLRLSSWREIGPYAQYSCERAVNDAYLARGLTRWLLVPGVYYHIGEDRHLDDPTQRPTSGRFARLRKLLAKLSSYPP
jgi:hypothetical protein